MRLYISLGIFNLNYLFYCILFFIIEIYDYLFIFSDDTDKNTIKNHKLLDISCFFLGYLLNIIPEWISNRILEAKSPNNLSIKDITKIFFISFFLLISRFLKIIPPIKDKKTNKDIYGYCFMFIQFLLIFLIPHSLEVYYRHQKFSFFTFTLIEILKTILFLFDKTLDNNLAIFFAIINSIIFAFYLIYIKGLIKYKYISPYTCNFIIGIITFPLIIIIYFIISFTSIGDENNDYYFDNIFNLFNTKLGVINVIRLMSLPITYGIFGSLVNKIIYDFTLYHIYLPFLVKNFIEEIFNQIESGNIFKFSFLILCFSIELIMILVFLEIIELHFCGFNKNLKKNIEFRALTETPLEIKDYNNDEVDNERNITK